MDILFARHGNTFAPGDRVVWVGRETDLPLVEKGRVQAAAAGQALVRSGLGPTVVYAASLKRTREFATIVATIVGNVPVVVDPRLDEIDYGPLGGLTTEEMIAANPAAEALLEAWGKRDVWPQGLGWTSTEADIRAAVTSFATERLAADETARPLVVSSNGVLRFLPRVLLEPKIVPDSGSFKLRTGGLGLIRREAGSAAIAFWDRAPDSLS